MRKYSVAIVCGTRPEIVKLAPVYRALQRRAALDVTWIHTGQHGDMARDMLRCFDIVPHFTLTRSGTSLEAFSRDCREQLDALQATRAWSAWVVQGDTESAFLGALSAFYARVPVAHVEAGLRTHDLRRPFPEEGIRQMISRIAAVHFVPTAGARAALLKEGVAEANISVTGNTVVDAQRWICRRYDIRRESSATGHILVTAHRREHWGAELEQTFLAIADIARAHPQRRVLFPVHLNPLVKGPAQSILGDIPNVSLVAPLDYLAMQRALAGAALLLTDSGGLQEEAPTFGVPTLVLRRETERPEAVEAGCAWLVGPVREDIVAGAQRLLAEIDGGATTPMPVNPFGDGEAAERIAAAVYRMVGAPVAPGALAKGVRAAPRPGMRLPLHGVVRPPVPSTRPSPL